MANNTDILTTIQGLRAMLQTLEAQVTGLKPAAVPKAPVAAEEKPKRQASEALKAWNAYVDKVKADMLTSGWTHPETGKPATRKDAMQEASRRRAADPDAPKPKPKPAPKAAETDGEAKPKRVLTEEQKAKMAAGRKAAAERRKAEKAAAEAASETAAEPKKPTLSIKATPPLPPSPTASDSTSTLLPLNLKGKKYLLNPETNGCYARNTDGSKGNWLGILDPVSKVIDSSVAESDFEGVYDE